MAWLSMPLNRLVCVDEEAVAFLVSSCTAVFQEATKIVKNNCLYQIHRKRKFLLFKGKHEKTGSPSTWGKYLE